MMTYLRKTKTNIKTVPKNINNSAVRLDFELKAVVKPLIATAIQRGIFFPPQMPNDISFFSPHASWNARDGGGSERWSSDIGDRRVFIWQKLIISHHTCAGAYLHLSCYFWTSQVGVHAASCLSHHHSN